MSLNLLRINLLAKNMLEAKLLNKSVDETLRQKHRTQNLISNRLLIERQRTEKFSLQRQILTHLHCASHSFKDIFMCTDLSEVKVNWGDPSYQLFYIPFTLHSFELFFYLFFIPFLMLLLGQSRGRTRSYSSGYGVTEVIRLVAL